MTPPDAGSTPAASTIPTLTPSSPGREGRDEGVESAGHMIGFAQPSHRRIARFARAFPYWGYAWTEESGVTARNESSIAESAAELSGLAGCLAGPSPVPAQGVAMVSQMLADGGGPLYRAGARDDLNAIIERAAQALTR